MKKSLFALAALSAFATTAQAQSSVTLYGNLDAAFVHDSGNGAASNGLVNQANSTSLWGLTGSEDLGGGMKMGFDLKSEINLNTGQTGSTSNAAPIALLTAAPTAAAPLSTGGSAPLFNRGANLSLTEASMGELKVGRMDDIEWAFTGSYSTSNSNSFGSNQAGAQMRNTAGVGLGTKCATAAAAGVLGNGSCGINNTLAAQGNVNASFSTSDAFVTAIQWTTPTVYGFTAKFQTSMGPESGTLAAGSGFGNAGMQAASLSYVGLGNNLNLGVATSRRNDETGQLAAVFSSFGAKYAVTPAITVTGLYQTTQWVNASINGVNTANTLVAGTPGTTEASGLNGNNMYSFGVNYKVNAKSDVSLAYTNVTSDTFSQNSVTMYGLTGRYNLSKRTQVYAGIGEAINSGGYGMNPIYGGSSYKTGASIGATIWASMLGLKHTF